MSNPVYKKYKPNKNWKDLRIGDVLKETIYTVMGDPVGDIIVRVIKTKDGYAKEVLADNGGVGYILKGTRSELTSLDDLRYCKRIGSSYEAKKVKL